MDSFIKKTEDIHHTVEELKDMYCVDSYFDPEQPFEDDKFGLSSKDKILALSIPFVKACGVYFLIFDGVIVYVGKSIDIHSRVSTHKNEEKKCFNRWVYFLVENEDLDNVEQAYIRKFRPFYNLNTYRTGL